MKIAYLMLVHTTPHIVKRAIQTLSTEDCAFFVHADKKSEIEQFSCIGGDNVFFCEPRIPVYWGEFSQVEASLLLIREAARHPNQFDYFNLMSGSDFPLRSGRYICEFLERNRGLEFMNLKRMPAPGFALSKINELRYPSDQPVRRFVSRAFAKLGMATRDYRKWLMGMAPYCGSQWWALSRDAVEYVMRFTASNPEFVEFFRHALTSDEMFFHTILGNSDYSGRVRRNLVYLDWAPDESHPAILTETHVGRFEKEERIWVEDEWGAGEVLFARKFAAENLPLIDRMDQMILRKDGGLGANKPATDLRNSSECH